MKSTLNTYTMLFVLGASLLSLNSISGQEKDYATLYEYNYTNPRTGEVSVIPLKVSDFYEDAYKQNRDAIKDNYLAQLKSLNDILQKNTSFAARKQEVLHALSETFAPAHKKLCAGVQRLGAIIEKALPAATTKLKQEISQAVQAGDHKREWEIRAQLTKLLNLRGTLMREHSKIPNAIKSLGIFCNTIPLNIESLVSRIKRYNVGLERMREMVAGTLVEGRTAQALLGGASFTFADIAPEYEEDEYSSSDYSDSDEESEPEVPAAVAPRLAVEPSDESSDESDDETTASEVDARRAEALLAAVEEGKVAQVKQLLADGANPNYQFKDEDEIPLLFASAAGFKEIVKLLLEAGANVNAADTDDRTPLHEAIQAKHDDIARLLLDRGANPLKRDTYGKMPMDYIEGGASSEDESESYSESDSDSE